MTASKIPVAILGATGTVGQKLVRRLEHHPWSEIQYLAASAASAGRRYADVVRWRETTPLPSRIGDLIVQPSDRPTGLPLAFSALYTGAATTIEPLWAGAGTVVVTNASPFRLASDVPLVIPEVNAEHLALLAEQRKRRGWRGAIIVNYRDALRERILGQTLLAVRLKTPFLLRTVEATLASCHGHRVAEVQRIGKRLAIRLDHEAWLVIHLMIAGRLHWKPAGTAIGAKSALAAFDFGTRTLLLTEWTDLLTKDRNGAFPARVTAFRPGMAVHGKFRQPCPDCGSPVQRIRYADNETNYCARYQTEGRLLANRALSRLLKQDWPKSLDELD